jgi:polyhydroxybutyrate depolymerase
MRRVASDRAAHGPMPPTSRTLSMSAITLLVLAVGATLGWAAHLPHRSIIHAPAACIPAAGDARVDGALLHIPPKAHAPLPLVVAFHGAGGTGDGFARESGLSRSADRHGFAVVYPNAGSSRHSWSLKRAAVPDDVARLRALLGPVVARACADPRRLYATGVSNGGGFAARVACEMSDTFAAVVPVAGGYRSLDPCPGGTRTSLMEIHGSADQIVPYRGRAPDRAGDVRTYVTGWARRDGCDAQPRETHPARFVTWVTYVGCDDGYAVEHVRLEGTDHGWPGARPPWPRHHPAGVLAREIVWRFFESRRLQQ